jgi:hypothetical protein
MNEAAYEATKAQLIPCNICGRRFAADRIQVHQRICKPGQPAKPIGVCFFILLFVFERDFILHRHQLVLVAVVLADDQLNDQSNNVKMLLMVFSIIRFEDIFIDNLDEYDGAPVSSSKRGGGGGAFTNSSSSGVTGLYPCSICNRNFASDRIQQHEQACKNAHKQRRTFDSTKQRLQGTEAAAYYRKGKGGKGRNEPAQPQVNITFF